MWGIVEGQQMFEDAQREQEAERRLAEAYEQEQEARRQLAALIRTRLKPWDLCIGLTAEEALLVADFLER